MPGPLPAKGPTPERTAAAPPGSNPAAGPGIEVEISNTQGHLPIDQAALSGLARRVLAGEGIDRASLSIALVDDRTIHGLNRRHLAHDWPTDVISFVLSEPGEPALSGELIVSGERAASVARRLGADAGAELALYVVHGLLHLCGYDDLTDRDRSAMRGREGEILAREGLTNTFPLDVPGREIGPVVDGERESGRWAD
jgi:probable rRNA maturation factor